MDNCDWSMEQCQVRGVSRCVLMEHGEQSTETTGQRMLLVLCVDNWGIQQDVSST